jgi:hypothetical protein
VQDTVGRVPIGSWWQQVSGEAILGPLKVLFARSGSNELVDSATGSEWDFSRRAIRGPLAGRQLTTIAMLRDYWFDWRAYHPDTAIFSAGLAPR